MSVYPVKFEKFWIKEARMTGLDKFVSRSKCAHCNGKMPSYGFIAYHALPCLGGYGFKEWWCSWSCCYGERKIKNQRIKK